MIFGCIADDVTGATDLASVFDSQGFTVQILFRPLSRNEKVSAGDVTIIALKSRTAPPDDAVEQSIAAFDELKRMGAQRIYFKYCSTMDSSDHGNIGNVIDALLARDGSSMTIAVPSYPDNGRTVHAGILYVNGIPLADSPMRSHPLTPMHESNVARVLTAQSDSNVMSLALTDVREGKSALRAKLASLDTGTPTIVVIDAETNRDLETIAAATDQLTFVTASAGLARGTLPQNLPRPKPDPLPFEKHLGGRLILSGSAASSTMLQVKAAASAFANRKLAPTSAAPTSAELQEMEEWVCEQWRAQPTAPVMIYSAASPDDVSTTPHEGDSDSIEEAFGTLARRLVRRGARQILVAGGETSGQIVTALGLQSLTLGPVISPGVVWGAGMTREDTDINLALKSGNFGDPQTFVRAWGIIS